MTAASVWITLFLFVLIIMFTLPSLVKDYFKVRELQLISFFLLIVILIAGCTHTFVARHYEEKCNKGDSNVLHD